MPHGVHSTRQTAFRLPEGLLAWLRDQAEREGRTMTDIAIAALETYRAAVAVRVAVSSDHLTNAQRPDLARSEGFEPPAF